MNILKISWKNILDKALTNGLSTLLMALGVGIIALIISLGKELDEKFTKNIKGIDMVVGAKGSPLQLILSSIYQIDAPTGNISFDEANTMARNPFIKKAIPIAMGDSYLGYRIVGTDSTYLSHYQSTVAEGKLFKNEMECVIGQTLAQKLNLKIGQKIASAHGLDNEGEKHDDVKYTITGILAYNNSVLDQLIITPLASVWYVHEHEQNESNALELLEEEPAAEATENKQITAMLVKFRNPMGLMTIPRNINANTTMQAALPAIEINRLFSLMGIGLDTLKWISFLIIFVSGLSVFVSLYNSLKERKYEMALMLSMGATRLKLFILLLLEGLIIGLTGFVIGMIMSKLALFAISKTAEESFHYQFKMLAFSIDELLIFLACIAISIFAAAIPSLGIYKINISKTLASQ
jgi:putative ABC transport system permease protein